MADKNLNIKVTTKQEGSNVLKDLNKEILTTKNELAKLKLAGQENSVQYQKLGETYKNLIGTKQALNNEFKNLSGTVSKSSTGFASLTDSVNSVKGATQLLVGIEVVKFLADIVKGAIDAGKQLVNLAIDIGAFGLKGAEFTQQRKAFDELNGGIKQSTEFLEQLRKASSGNLNDQELIRYANAWQTVGLSQEQSVIALDIAERFQDRFTDSINGSTDAIKQYIQTGRTTGIRQLVNPEELKNLQEKIQKTKNLTEEESRFEAVNQLLGKSLDEINSKTGDSADLITSVAKEYENAKLKLQQWVGEAIQPAVKVILDFVNRIKELITEIQNVIENNNALEQSFRVVGDGIVTFAKANLTAISAFINANLTIVNWVAQIISGVVDVTVKGLVIFAESIKSFIEFSNSINPFGNIGTGGIDNFINKAKELQTIKAKDAELIRVADGFSSNSGNTKKNSGKGSNNKEDEEQLNTEQKILKEIADIQEKLAIETLPNQRDIFRQQIKDKKTLLSLLAGEYNQIVDINKLQAKTIDTPKIQSRKERGDFTKGGDPKPIINTLDIIALYSKDIFDSVLDVGKELVSMLDLGAHTFVSQLVNGLQSGISLVTSIVGLVSKIAGALSGGGGASKAGSGGGGISGFLGGILSLIPGFGTILGGIAGFFGGLLGFSEGGYTGDGGKYEPAGIVHKGEFVVSKENVAKNYPLLMALNSNKQSKGFGYAMGGLVSPNRTMAPSVYIQANMDGLTFMRVNDPKYREYNKAKRL